MVERSAEAEQIDRIKDRMITALQGIRRHRAEFLDVVRRPDDVGKVGFVEMAAALAHIDCDHAAIFRNERTRGKTDHAVMPLDSR